MIKGTRAYPKMGEIAEGEIVNAEIVAISFIKIMIKKSNLEMECSEYDKNKA